MVHNEDSPALERANVTRNRITGLGMAPDMVVAGRRFDGGITYDNFEALELRLGYGRDEVTVESTHNGTTAIFAGRGDDEVWLRTVDGHTVVYGQDGDDTVRLGRALGTGQTVDDLAALVAVDGGAGYDSVYVDDCGRHRPPTSPAHPHLADRDGHGRPRRPRPALPARAQPGRHHDHLRDPGRRLRGRPAVAGRRPGRPDRRRAALPAAPGRTVPPHRGDAAPT